MTPELVKALCEWSKTIDSRVQPKYLLAVNEVLTFLRMDEAARREAVRMYSDRFCIRNFDVYRASGIYLLFRLAFDLPKSLPRAEAQVFGSWLHPSVGEPDISFDLSWPAQVDRERVLVKIARFQGYAGKGYDALGEYEYFASHFHLRSEAFVSRMVISSE